MRGKEWGWGKWESRMRKMSQGIRKMQKKEVKDIEGGEKGEAKKADEEKWNLRKEDEKMSVKESGKGKGKLRK